MQLFVARQPILNRKLSVVAYEMLYRSSMENTFDGTDAQIATSKVINALFYSPDGQDLLARRTAFINFPETLLLNDTPSLLPSQKTVIEVLETVDPSPEVVEACQRLRARGFKIALDDFTDTEKEHPLVPVADFIKVDFKCGDRDRWAAIAKRYGKRCQLIAEKVETIAEFHWAKDNGYTYFQGYFFARPQVSSVFEISGLKQNFLEIIRAIHAPDMNLGQLAKVIEREPTLSYKLLRLANSALFGRRHAASQVYDAMLRIGEDEVKRWLSVIVLMDLASDSASEVVVSALVRARFCELLGLEAGLDAQSGELFLLGLFSHLDVMFGRSLAEILNGLKLPDYILKPLLEPNGDDMVSRLWTTVVGYEVADWELIFPLLPALNIEPECARVIYAQAVTWADRVLGRR
jgi:EAL and modified HD-GYP domain-containing signal transduction protein